MAGRFICLPVCASAYRTFRFRRQNPCVFYYCLP